MISRRRFLAGASVHALATCIPYTGVNAAAHMNSKSATQQSRCVINGLDAAGGPSYAFINFAKAMGSRGGQVAFQGLMNADGYPTSSLANTSGYGSVTSVDAALLAPTVTWVLSWQGNGGVELNNGTVYGQTNFVVTAGSGFVGGTSVPLKLTNVMIASGANGYLEFRNGPGATQLALKFSPYVNYDGSMTNLQLYRKSDQAALQTGEIFTPEFITLMKSLNPRVIRTMDWSRTNFNNVSRFAYRAVPTAVTYYDVRWDPMLWAGVTYGSSAGYVCANPKGSSKGAYVDGETVQVQFHIGNSVTAPTLNVGGRGAVPIQLNYAAPLAIGSISTNTCTTLVYDAWLNVWLGDFSIASANNVGGGLTTGVPIEIQVALCNKLGTDLWYNFPFHYDDASCAAAVSYIRDNLNPNLNAYFEFSNEVWNFGLSQTSLAAARGAYLGFPSASFRQIDGYYGLRVRQVMTVAAAAWAPRSNATLRRVLAVWESNAAPQSVDMYRLRGTDLDTRNGYSNYNTVVGTSYSNGGPLFTRPIDVCDTISYATYYAGPNLGGNNGDLSGLNTLDIAALKQAADNYAAGVATSNQALIASSLAWVDNDIRQGTTQKMTASVSSDGTTLMSSTTAPGAGTAVVCWGTLPAGLSSAAVYYIVNPKGNAFQISLSFGGAPLGGLATSGGGFYIGQLGGETLLFHKTFYYADPNSRGFGWDQIAAEYDGLRPPSFSNLKIECYEGGLESCPPSQGQCSAVGLSGSTYGTSTIYGNNGYQSGGTGGAIYNLLQGYKNSALAKQLVLDQMNQFMSYRHSVSAAWYVVQGYSQWSLMPAGTLSTPYQTFQGVSAFGAQ